MNALRLWLSSVLRAWNNFWFDSRRDDTLVTLSAFRLFFGAVMLFCYAVRAFDVEFFYSHQGILPAWLMPSIDYFKYHPSIFTDSTSLFTLHAAHALFLLCLGLQTIGLFTRPAAIGTYLLHLMFANRNMSAMFGVDMIASFFLFYLCFAETNARYSVDAWRGKGARHLSVLGHLAWRLMQIQVCVVYGYSGLEKMKGTRWWDGSALWDVMTIGNMQRFDLSFLAHAPFLLAAGVYVVLFWEIYFPLLVWIKPTRLPTLAFGVLLHVGIYLFMNLPSFGFMMITLYLLFLRAGEIEAGMRGLSLRSLRPNARL